MLVCGCSSEGHLLAVDLRTDLAPAVEFDGVRTEVLLSEAERVVLREEALADPDRSYLEGVRVAEADELASGTYVVRVQLVRGGGVVVERRVRLEVRADRGLVVVITRTCRDVACPGASDDLAATTCLGGRCVDPRCVAPGDPDCGDVEECSAAADCPGPAATCAEPVCLAGTCGHAALEMACPPSSVCDPTTGCETIVPGTDGGSGDASVDAGGRVDGGPVDAGSDAGPAPDTGVRIAAGTSHTCAVGRDSRAYCWGSNTYGELGVAGGGSATAQRVVPLADVGAVAVDFGHTCAITVGRDLFCWGRNDSGQLGDGTTTDRAMPVRVPLPEPVIAVSLGAGHTCAVTSSGDLFCWGDNGEGQLGTGDTTDRSTPVRVMGVQSYLGVAVGDFHSCGSKTSGEVWCWGSNGRGQLGRGMSGATLPLDPVPRAVTGVSDAAALSADYRLTCALRSGGTIACWGEGISGQLGNGATSDANAPVAVLGIADAVDVSAGAFHACAVLDGGSARCWGSGAFGKLGDGSTEDRSTPVAVGGATDFARISAGTGHFTCGVRSTGEVVCWGRNQNAQLGTGDATDRMTPSLVIGLP